MSLKVILVDDSASDLLKLHAVLEEYVETHGMDVQFLLKTETSGIPYTSPAIYFIDINMPEMSGFELAVNIQRGADSPCIIFCTNTEDLVFDTFRLNCFSFVRKSGLKQDVYAAMDRYRQNDLYTFYTLRLTSRSVTIQWKDISYFFLRKNSVLVYTRERPEPFRENKPSADLREELPPGLFGTCTNRFLVNFSRVTGISERSVLLDTHGPLSGTPAEISDFRSQYMNYLMFR